MRERRCQLVPVGNIVVARLSERVYGRAESLLVEEYDVTWDFFQMVEAMGYVKAPPVEAPEMDSKGQEAPAGGDAEPPAVDPPAEEPRSDE